MARHYGLRRHRVLALVAALVGAASLAVAQTVIAQTAQELVAANIAAMGGEEAIARIENYTSSGAISIESPLFGNLEGTIEAVRIPGRAYFESVELGPITQQKGWDGERAWERGATGVRMLEGAEARALAMQSYPSNLVALQQLAPAGLRIERLEDADVNGRPHYVLRVSSDGAPPSTLYLDRESHLLARSASVTNVPGVGPRATVIDVGDYESVAGVLLPTRLTIDTEGISITRLALDRTVANTAVDDAIFAVPDGGSAQTTRAVDPAPTGAPADPFAGPYAELCSVCHGPNLEGAAQGPSLVGELRRGDSIDALVRSIAEGAPAAGMPAWSETLDDAAIHRLAIFIGEQRNALSYADFKVAAPPALPAGAVASEQHAFRVETVAEHIDPLPYAIAPLPDGRILVTEKTQGLRIVMPDGTLSAPIRGTPRAYDDGFELPGILLVFGQGYLLDIAPHPNYADNGWIYLSYTERCNDCNAASRTTRRPVSMVALVRGRIRDGAWLDQETIWRADIEQYTAIPDIAAGGRIAFDGAGHVFLTVGIKGGSEIAGVQDLSLPYGKIHRLNDDGGLPEDNPFVDVPNALASVWTYGHRSPQGLEHDPETGLLWGTEMGQRGGDEVNVLRPGRNYGWPLYSKGMQYDGRPVDFAAELGIEFELEDIEQPVADLTPSPAVSSFVIYAGGAFPAWRRNLLVGTLKATKLYRMVVEGERIVHMETLLDGLGRIRDVETDRDGLVYLLLEHAEGSRIVRLVPARGR
jgi:glucose/arabinose dehydrogenase